MIDKCDCSLIEQYKSLYLSIYQYVNLIFKFSGTELRIADWHRWAWCKN